MSAADSHPPAPRWWTDPAWITLPWACPGCGLMTLGVPAVAGQRLSFGVPCWSFLRGAMPGCEVCPA